MALKIVYKICCGIDVHKTFVVACITSTDNKDITSYMVVQIIPAYLSFPRV